MSAAGGGFDARTIGELLGGKRTACHEQREHAHARGLADGAGQAAEVGFCIHASMVSELLGADKRMTGKHGGGAGSASRRNPVYCLPLMKDLTIVLPDHPGSLAAMGEALGRAGVSIEGGAAFVVAGEGVAHFLVADGDAARQALAAAGIQVGSVRDVLVQRLRQDEPGQLGKLTRRMAEAGVNIEVLYSDHAHQLILVVDDPDKGRDVSEAWMREGRGPVAGRTNGEAA